MAQMNYAIITLGGKQYVVHEGETILVDRLDREGIVGVAWEDVWAEMRTCKP